MNQKNLIVTIIVLTLAVVGGAYLFTADTGSSPDTTEASKYFEERMTTLGAEDIGQPIEGFDAMLLIAAFPGLEARDFDGVETLEGRYVFRDGELSFERRQRQPVSSAERMISAAGYATLLEHVAARLGMEASSTEAVDNLVERVNTAEFLEARIDQGASAFGVKVVPLAVLEDSRCPSDVNCVQAGTVRVRAELQSGLGTATEVFSLGGFITTEAERVTLLDVLPPAVTEEIPLSEYRFLFKVEKLPSR